jgi:hypothetical protein
MMNRRWFFTAAGSAYLSACCSFVGKKAKKKNQLDLQCTRPVSADDQFAQILEKFFLGLADQLKPMQALPTAQLSEAQLPRDMRSIQQIYRQPLTDIYRKRFDHRLSTGEISDPVYCLLLLQACVLGQLTGLAFAYESGANGDSPAFSFEKPDATPVLGTKHLEWARDTYGIYTNSKTPKRTLIKLCGEPGGPQLPDVGGTVEIDDACPFCFA